MNRILTFLIPLLACLPPAFARQDRQGRGGEAGAVLTLQEAVRQALARGPDVLLAQAEAAKAGEALRETRSINLPQVVVGTGLAYNNGFPLSIEGAAPSIIQLGVNQAIFSKKNRNLIREAEEGSKAGAAAPDSARNGLAARTAMLYGELHWARQVVPLLEEQRRTAEATRQAVESLLQAGKVRPVDLAQARVAVANIDQQLLTARERVRVAEEGLREISGMAAGETIRTEAPRLDSEALTQSEDVLYQRALEVHPEIREAEATVRAREFHLEAEQGERYPQLAIVSQYALFSRTNNYQDFFNRFTRNNYLLGLSVQFPIFDGFRASARVAESRQDAEAARLRLQRLKSELKLNIQRSASDLRVAAGAADLARLETEAAGERLKVSESLMEAGRIDPRDLDSARAQFLEKRLAEVEASRTLFERQVALLQATGSLAGLF